VSTAAARPDGWPWKKPAPPPEIPKWKRKGGGRRPKTERNAEIVALVEGGRTRTEVGLMYGIDRRTVGYIVTRYGSRK
jgi:hypothetical protein